MTEPAWMLISPPIRGSLRVVGDALAWSGVDGHTYRANPTEWGGGEDGQWQVNRLAADSGVEQTDFVTYAALLDLIGEVPD